MSVMQAQITEAAMSVCRDLSGLQHGIGRALIDGAVVVYNLDDPPAWLQSILANRDEDGSLEATGMSVRVDYY